MGYRFRYIFVSFLLLLSIGHSVNAQKVMELVGCITDSRTKEPLEGVMVHIQNAGVWSISDEKGCYTIDKLDEPAIVVSFYLLGYQKQSVVMHLKDGKNIRNMTLSEMNLSLDEVVVTAQRRTESLSSSFVIDRNTLDHAQILNLSYVTSLLPGGKTIGDQNLATGAKSIALHAGPSSELGNSSFGTAIDLDGQRLDNNALLGEIRGVDLRNIGSSNIESVEVVLGIPSVEYGDLSNGMVKINSRKGRTPFMVELMAEPKTKSIALSKGFSLGHGIGTLNVNAEHTRSITNLASPHTAYMRNNINLTYSNTFKDRMGHPLSLTASLSGNIGGYNSEADPDEFKDTYTRMRDYVLRSSVKLHWLLDKSWISNLTLQTSVSYGDKLNETKTNKSSASTQPYIHTTEAGYHIAELYEANPNANIILGPTGYWYVRSFTDSKPLSYSVKAKADWSHRWGKTMNTILFGSELSASGNKGRGLYYDDMRVAPTWREYRYDKLPFMNNVSFFFEDKFSMPVGRYSSLHMRAGVRSDITMIKDSEYGTMVNLSPRINVKYNFWTNKKHAVSDISLLAGWGKSVKQPSFSVLYPAPTYSDKLAFAPGTTPDGKTIYAYYTQPTTPKYNPELKCQYTLQNELGLEATILGTRISLTAFRNKTFNPYMSRNIYTPYTYKLTSQSDIDAGCTIPMENRQYTIDRHTGIVTVSDLTGRIANQVLRYKERNTYVSQIEYTNGSPVERRGMDLIVDFPQIRSLRTSIRLDGNYYWYKGLNETLVASMGQASASMDGTPYKYVGYYTGTSTASNGSLSRQINGNLTISTHIPNIRMIFSLRLETSLYNYEQNLSEYADGRARGYLLEAAGDFHGTKQGGIYNKDSYVAVYPEYYTEWDNPEEKIPFLDKFLWARENDRELYQDLCKLVVKSNTTYFFNENRISAYYAANFNVTKELGKWASITIYARNFLYQMGKVKSSQTGLESSLFDSNFIPKFYYGMSVRIKL